MTKAQRALIEIQNWVEAKGEGFSINYAAHNPAIINDIPHHWNMQAGRTDKEHYTGYGVTMEQAILSCYQAWQDG